MFPVHYCLLLLWRLNSEVKCSALFRWVTFRPVTLWSRRLCRLILAMSVLRNYFRSYKNILLLYKWILTEFHLKNGNAFSLLLEKQLLRADHFASNREMCVMTTTCPDQSTLLHIIWNLHRRCMGSGQELHVLAHKSWSILLDLHSGERVLSCNSQIIGFILVENGMLTKWNEYFVLCW
jgi:hypothetical protein